MKEYELDKSTGELTWKEERKMTREEIEKLDRLLDDYIIKNNNDGFKKNK